MIIIIIIIIINICVFRGPRRRVPFRSACRSDRDQGCNDYTIIVIIMIIIVIHPCRSDRDRIPFRSACRRDRDQGCFLLRTYGQAARSSCAAYTVRAGKQRGTFSLGFLMASGKMSMISLRQGVIYRKANKEHTVQYTLNYNCKHHCGTLQLIGRRRRAGSRQGFGQHLTRPGWVASSYTYTYT